MRRVELLQRKRHGSCVEEEVAADIVMTLAIGVHKAVGVRVGGAPLEGPYLGHHVIPRVVIRHLRHVPAHIPVQMAAAFLERHATRLAAMGHQLPVPIPVIVVAPFLGLPAHAPKEHPIIIPARVVPFPVPHVR